MAFRRHTFRIDAQALTPTSSGGLRVERARLARVGLQEYRTPSGSIIEYRDPAEVFSPESLASYRDAALTIWHHPDEDVTAENWEGLAKGHIAGPGVRVGDWVEAPVVISAGVATKAVKRGDLVELSCGYDTVLVHEPGEYQGRRYDARQTQIRINHITLLPPGRARAGRDARLVTDEDELEPERVRRLDAKGDEIVDDLDGGEKKMPKHTFRRDGLPFEVEGDPSAIGALQAFEGDLAKARKDAEAEKKRADEAEKKRDELKGQLAVATDPKKRADEIAAHVKLVDDAAALGAKRDELAKLSTPREIMLLALGKSFKADEDTSDAELSGAFKYAVSKAKDGKGRNRNTDDGDGDRRRDHLDDAAAAIFGAVTNTDGASADQVEETARMLDELDELEEEHHSRLAGRRRAEDGEE